eukprot:14652854-Ditylum_brightwellii.AAC.1
MKEKEMPTVRTCPDMKTTPTLLPLKTKNADGQESARHEDNIDPSAPQEKMPDMKTMLILLPLKTSILKI